MSKKLFVFYDFETTGISPAFDQPLQFAAVLTDEDFNEIESVDLRCRLSPHILPAPMALAVTGVSPDLLNNPDLPSWFEFSGQLGDLISHWGPATWVGYNSISFDENVLRQTFYQNLHPELYQTQTNGNERMDVMHVVYAAWVLARDCLTWPRDEKGRVIFKLDQLAPANGFTEHNAHDALGDVRATLFILSLIRDRAPDLFTRCVRNKDKQAVISDLEVGQPMQLIERFGAAPPRSYIGVYAGHNPANKNTLGFLDLEACSPSDLIDADAATLDHAVSASPKLIRSITANKSPNLFPFETDDPAFLRGADLVRSRADFRERVGAALARRYQDRPEPKNVEEQIYSGFYSSGDKALLRRFQDGDWGQRNKLLGQLEDARLVQLGRRIVFENAPGELSNQYATKAEAAIQAKWSVNDPKAPWTNWSDVREQLREIRAKDLLSEPDFRALNTFYNKLAE